MNREFLVMAVVVSALASPIMVNSQEILENIDQELITLDRNAEEADKVAIVAANFVTSPLGRWTLLRKGAALCAVRFTALRHERAKDKMPSTATDSFFADYDWVFQGDGTGDITKANAKTGHGEVSKKPNLWRFIRGSRFIECDSVKPQWWYPNRIFLIKSSDIISYNPTGSTQPNGIEIALTGWKAVWDVNAHDPRLVWRRFDPERDLAHINDEPTIIPVGELPGFH